MVEGFAELATAQSPEAVDLSGLPFGVDPLLVTEGDRVVWPLEELRRHFQSVVREGRITAGPTPPSVPLSTPIQELDEQQYRRSDEGPSPLSPSDAPVVARNSTVAEAGRLTRAPGGGLGNIGRPAKDAAEVASTSLRLGRLVIDPARAKELIDSELLPDGKLFVFDNGRARITGEYGALPASLTGDPLVFGIWFGKDEHSAAALVALRWEGGTASFHRLEPSIECCSTIVAEAGCASSAPGRGAAA